MVMITFKCALTVMVSNGKQTSWRIKILAQGVISDAHSYTVEENNFDDDLDLPPPSLLE